MPFFLRTGKRLPRRVTEVALIFKRDPALDHWAAHGKPELYEPGTWGPESAAEMLRNMGREWRRS